MSYPFNQNNNEGGAVLLLIIRLFTLQFVIDFIVHTIIVIFIM